MKKKHLKKWVQDLLIVSALGKVCFLGMLADFVPSWRVVALLTYVLVTLGAEIYLLGKYELRPSMLVGKE